MTLENAINEFKKEYGERKITGYWENGDSYILNTLPMYGEDIPEVCQFRITKDGIYPTNPVRDPIIMDKPMRKVR